MSDKVQAILDAVNLVPPFPQVVLKAVSLLEKPDTTASEVVEVIRFDPVITLRILKICNSAAFGLLRKVESLQHALVLLGSQRMKRILMTSGAFDALNGDHPGYGFEPGELWRHSVACALMSQVLMKAAEEREDELLFTGALLHDIGKSVLSAYADREHQSILQRIWSNNYSSLEAEREVLGLDHAQVGSMLSERWQLPQGIVTIIARHHDPVDTSCDPLPVCLAHLSDLLCLQLGIGVGTRGMATRASPEIIRSLGWPQSKLDVCVATFWEEFEQVGELFDLKE